MNKNKTIISFYLILMFTFCSFAFEYSFGIKAGIGTSGFYGKNAGLRLYLNPPYDTSYASITEYSKTSFIYGLFFKLNFNEYVNFQIELLNEHKGKHFKQIVSDTAKYHSEGGINLEYLEMPFLLIFKKKISRFVAPYIFIGPSVSLLISRYAGLFQYYNQNNKIYQPLYDDDYDSYSSFDFGLPFGIGSEIRIHWVKLGFEFRYTPDFISVAKHSTKFFKGSGINNNFWSISLAYYFLNQ